VDKVYIRQLHIEAVIGVHDWERELRQSLLLDLELGTDIRPAAAGDDLGQALDYAAISQRLVEWVSNSRFQLIETLAEGCAQLVLTEFNVPWLRLRLAKPGAVAEAAEVGVLIERGRRR